MFSLNILLQPGRVNIMKLYSPPFILAKTQPAKKIKVSLTDSQETANRNRVLFCTYCLSEDQRLLLAVCTDDKGELMETCTINIEIPNRRRRKQTSARKIALCKLWDFILGVISMTNFPWRLVIGRFGRIGHGELKGEIQIIYFLVVCIFLLRIIRFATKLDFHETKTPEGANCPEV